MLVLAIGIVGAAISTVIAVVSAARGRLRLLGRAADFIVETTRSAETEPNQLLMRRARERKREKRKFMLKSSGLSVAENAQVGRSD